MTALALLNDWQRGFPLVDEPFAAVGARHGLEATEVLAQYRAAQADGRLARIGAVFAAGAGGAGLLAAMAVPAARLEAVAARISALPGVNHNYEREHALNLWFVVHGGDAAALRHSIARIEADTDLAVLCLPMRRAYRIDLGFDLRGAAAASPVGTRAEAPAPLPMGDHALAALAEAGLPLVERPYAAWAEALACPPAAVTAALARWLAAGQVKRFGTVVRHHEFGFDANAMAVFDIPDERVDALGHALARDAAVSLVYRRERGALEVGAGVGRRPAIAWPFNLYCMVHGRDRDAVRAVLAGLHARHGLAAWPHEALFSRRRFKQCGPRRFAAEPLQACDVA